MGALDRLDGLAAVIPFRVFAWGFLLWDLDLGTWTLGPEESLADVRVPIVDPPGPVQAAMHRGKRSQPTATSVTLCDGGMVTSVPENMSLPRASLLFLAVLVGLLTSCRKSEWSKAEVVDWYARYGSIIRGGLGYQGSDQKYHHFIARSLDEWVFIAMRREELELADERPFSRASDAPLAYYAVDPSRGFRKIGEDGAANQTVSPPPARSCHADLHS